MDFLRRKNCIKTVSLANWVTDVMGQVCEERSPLQQFQNHLYSV